MIGYLELWLDFSRSSGSNLWIYLNSMVNIVKSIFCYGQLVKLNDR